VKKQKKSRRKWEEEEVEEVEVSGPYLFF